MTRRSFTLVILGGITAACNRSVAVPTEPTLPYTTQPPPAIQISLATGLTHAGYQVSSLPFGNSGGRMLLINGSTRWNIRVNGSLIGIGSGNSTNLDLSTVKINSTDTCSVAAV